MAFIHKPIYYTYKQQESEHRVDDSKRAWETARSNGEGSNVALVLPTLRRAAWTGTSCRGHCTHEKDERTRKNVAMCFKEFCVCTFEY